MTDAKHLRKVLPDSLSVLSLRIGLSDIYRIIRAGEREYRMSTVDSRLHIYFDSVEDAPMNGLLFIKDGMITGKITDVSEYNTCVEWRP